MAYFALLWKARAVEKYRLKYETEKINSMTMAGIEVPRKTLFQKWRTYKYDTQKRISRRFSEWYPEGSAVSNLLILLKTDQSFPNFLLKSVIGFVGGIVLTYICFMFFVFQLSISLVHATIMSSIIGVLLTLGLAFSYRIRCLVFLLIPQFFSRVGRYTLTCYALVLILTGPATNTLKNSEVLSESMACSQEQIKTNAQQLNESIKRPMNLMKESIKPIMERFNEIANKMKWSAVKINRLTMSIVSVIESNFFYLKSLTRKCNDNLGTPYKRCMSALKEGVQDCMEKFGRSWLNDAPHVANAACDVTLSYKRFCPVIQYIEEDVIADVKKKIKTFSEHLASLLNIEVNIHHWYTFSSNTSRSTSQVTAGIVTEIRKRADPLLTWLSWSSCVTSLSLLLIIFRAKYYQHMYETRSRFDNRYITQELRDLDMKRLREGRETVLPLNRRERAKYITTTSFSLVASERRYMSRSAVFMAITTFKLLIHMVADYSLYWVLMTIRYHGIFQSPLQAGVSNTGAHITGSGFVTNLLKSIVETLNIPLEILTPSPISCLPNPNPPDFRRYTQIGVLIFLLWFFALFEPYGLRLRHLIMGHYRPERAKARAVWLNNHILRTRGSFMKLARRKLHKEYKYTSESKYTFKRWLDSHIPFQCLRTLLGTGPVEPHCLLCGENSKHFDQNSDLTRCKTRDCPGIYCAKCFSDIGQLCTICMSPSDYGDLSDVDLEKGSSDESDDEDKDPGNTSTKFLYRYQHSNEDENFETTRKPKKYITRFFSKNSSTDKIPLLPLTSHNMNEIISENLQKYDYTENHNILNIISKLKNAFNLMHIRKEELSLEKSDILYRIHDENSFKYIIQNMKSIYFDNLLSKYVIHDTEAYRTDKYVYNSNKELNSHTKFIESIRSSQNKNFHMKSEFNEFLISKYLEVTEILLKCTVYEIMKKNKSVIVTKLKRDTELSKRLKRKFSLLRRRKKTQKLHVSKLKNVARYYRKIPREKIVKQNVPSFNKELPKTAKRNLKDTRKNDKNSKRSSSKRNEDNCKKERKYKKANKNSRQDKSKTNKRRKGDFRIPTDDKKTNKISMKCSSYWNNLKCNLIPCIHFINISNQQVVTTKKLNNFKRRKKNNNESEYQIDKNLENREDMRNFKLSTYLYDRYWANIKHNNDIENNGNYLSHTLKNSDKQEKEMDCETTDAKGLTNEVMKSDTVSLNTFVEPIETDENDTVKCLYKKRNVGCIPAYISLHERALNRFRRKVNRRETTTSPIVSLTRKICEDKGCCVRSKVKTNFKNQNENKTVKCCCRLRQKKAVSCACKENDEPTEKTEDAKPTDHVPDEDLNKTGEIIEKCGIAKVLNDIEDEKDDSKTKFNVNKKRSEKYTAPFFERLQNSYSTIRKFYATLFTELFEKNNVCKTCICQTAAASQPKVEKATAVKPRTRSCGCQCLPKMQEKTTQLGRPLVEVSQCVSEKFTIDAEVDASNRQHTCTCAAQQRILSRDVGTLRKSLLQSTSSVGDKSSINTNTNSLSMDSLQSISSIYSDGTKTDTTVCSLATTDYHGEITHNSRGDNDGTRNKRTDYKLEKHLTKLEYNERALHRTRKHRIKVVTKANQSTLTDRTKLCDVSTITNDWWSPIVERKDMKIVKRQRCHAEKSEKKYMKNTGVGPDEKIVTFRSRAQIIPPGKTDILSPSRYLLESQRYYNELFAYNLHTPQLLSLSQHQKQVTEKNRSLSVRHHSRRGTTHKNKRLEQCYSPRKQASSRKWDMEFIMSPEAAKYRKASYPMIN